MVRYFLRKFWNACYFARNDSCSAHEFVQLRILKADNLYICVYTKCQISWNDNRNISRGCHLLQDMGWVSKFAQKQRTIFLSTIMQSRILGLKVTRAYTRVYVYTRVHTRAYRRRAFCMHACCLVNALRYAVRVIFLKRSAAAFRTFFCCRCASVRGMRGWHRRGPYSWRKHGRINTLGSGCPANLCSNELRHVPRALVIALASRCDVPLWKRSEPFSARDQLLAQQEAYYYAARMCQRKIACADINNEKRSHQRSGDLGCECKPG